MWNSVFGKFINRAAVAGIALGLAACASQDQSAIQLGVTTDQDGVPRTGAVTGEENPRAKSLEERIANEGGVQMNGEQATAYLSGNTQQWAQGGAYYGADGMLDYIWEGKKYFDYTWTAKRSGEICIQNKEGFTTSCSLYFNHKNTVYTVVLEVFGESQDFFGGPDTLLAGNQLGNLRPWDPALSGN